MSGPLALRLQNRFDDLLLLQRTVDQLVADHAIDADGAYRLRLCVEELVSNVIRHAFRDAGLHWISVIIQVGAPSIDVMIEDDGRPFDPNTLPEVEEADSLEHAPTGGMGLTLVKQMAGPIRYDRTHGHNRVCVRIPREVARVQPRG